MTGRYEQLLNYVVFADWIFFGLTVAWTRMSLLSEGLFFCGLFFNHFLLLLLLPFFACAVAAVLANRNSPDSNALHTHTCTR